MSACSPDKDTEVSVSFSVAYSDSVADSVSTADTTSVESSELFADSVPVSSLSAGRETSVVISSMESHAENTDIRIVRIRIKEVKAVNLFFMADPFFERKFYYEKIIS